MWYIIYKLGKDLKIIHCRNKEDASKKALEQLKHSVDKDILLLFSGGTSPDLLYQLIAEEKQLYPGAVALIDERYGEPMHTNSNEKMITDTGLVDYINKEGIPFLNILTGAQLQETAEQYEQVIQDLFVKFPKKIAVVGIGADSHTAGIKPDLDYEHSKLVIAYDDQNGSFGKRVTLTFEALEKIDEFVILAFGENKIEPLQKMLTETDRKKIPAVFYRQTSSGVVVFTDC